MAPFAREGDASRLVFDDRLRARADDDDPLGPVDHDPVVGCGVFEQTGDGEYCRQTEGARHDRGVAFDAALFGSEAGDVLRIHQSGVSWAQLVGENDGTFSQTRISDVGLFDQVADESFANHPDVFDPRRQIGVAHRCEALGNLVDLDLDGTLGVDPGPCDALVDAAHEARIRQHREVRVEQVADLLGGGFGQPRGFRLELAQLAQGDRHRLGKPTAFGVDLGLREVALADREIAALGDMSGSDGDPGRHAQALQSALGGGALVREPGRFVNPHRICIRSAEPVPPRLLRPRVRWRSARSPRPGPRPASAAP